MVTLATVSDGAKQEFEVEHAERILAIPRCGWVLADPKYEIKNGTITPRDSGKGNKETA